MSMLNLQELIGKWIEDDSELSKHFIMSNCCIMGLCRRPIPYLVSLNGLIYGEIYSNGIDLYTGPSVGSLKIVTLIASQPNFFECLRETIIKAHNKTQWCKTPIK
jgi:hypothetical protein